MVNTTPSPEPQGLPTAAIVCICIGAYIVLIVILLVVRECMMRRNMWHSMACCGKEGEIYCCECWISCCESCNCCAGPDVTSCLDSVCPARRHYDCGDVVACQCCAECCKSCCGENGCDCCEGCNCNCSPPECDTINCCCFEIQMKQPQSGMTSQYPNDYPQRGGYGDYPPQRGNDPQRGAFAAGGGGGGGQYPQRGGAPRSGGQGNVNNAFLASGARPT